MKALSEFFPRLLPYVPGCSEPLAAQAVLDAAIQFCDDSLVIREPLASFNTTVGEATYTLTPPASQEISRILKVVVDDTELEGVLAEVVGELDDNNAFPTSFFTSRTDSALRLLLGPKPDKVYPVIVTVALKPTRTAATVQDDLFDRWADPIVLGALARIMAVPGQPFTSLPLSRQRSIDAARMTHRARTEGMYGRVRGSMSVSTRPFA